MCLFIVGQLSAQPAANQSSVSSLESAVKTQDLPLLKRLLQQGANPDQSGEFSTSPLHWAAHFGFHDALLALLKAGANPNIKTDTGVTPLELAIMQHNVEDASALLKAGAVATTQRLSGESMLMIAAESGQTRIATLLLEHGAEADARETSFGQTALMFAARAGHADIVKLLLKQGADPNSTTNTGPTPPFIGPNSMRGFGFGEGIIRGGVPADRGRREPIAGGMTPLLYAARHNHLEVARLLLDAGAEIDKTEANGIWPLLMAISNDNTEIAHFLLNAGGQVNGQDWYGRSPLWEAVNVRNLYVHNAKYENYIDRAPYLPLITALLDAGADVNARTKEAPPVRNHLLEITGSLEWVDFTGQTPFLTAALAGDVTIMKLLLDYGADPLIETFEGTNALMAAAGINWVVAQTWTEGPEQLLEAVKLCYSLGMDVNHSNSMGLTALHGAANRGSDDIIEYLVSIGAKLDAVDKIGRTPLKWAKGVFLATHPGEPKPSSIALLTRLLQEQGLELR